MGMLSCFANISGLTIKELWDRLEERLVTKNSSFGNIKAHYKDGLFNFFNILMETFL